MTRVLFVSQQDWAGICIKFAQVLDTAAGYETRALTRKPHSFAYPIDIMADNRTKVWEWIQWADVVVAMEYWPRLLLPPGARVPKTEEEHQEVASAIGRPIVALYAGNHCRAHHEQVNALDAAAGVRQWAIDASLTMHGPLWMPVPMPNLSAYRDPQPDRWVVCQAPSRRKNKGTNAVIWRLKGIEAELEIVEHVTNEECLRRKGRADIYVDQFRHGYGVNSLEAWAMGIPVVANAYPEILAEIRRLVGYLPFARAEFDELRTVVERLMEDRAFYRAYRILGAGYVRRYHAPEVVAARMARELEEVLGAAV